MSKKRLYAKRACNRIPKEQISAEDMKRPDISESVNKYGYSDQSFEITDVTRNCLDYLVTLGYVRKRKIPYIV